MADVIARGLAADPDDFSAQVLQQAQQTGQISEADWKQANANWISCIKSLGFEADVFYEGTNVTYHVALSNEVSQMDEAGRAAVRQTIRQTCDERTNTYVNMAYDSLYRESWKNDPRQVDERVIACLQQAGLASETLTYEELEADLAAGEASRYGPSSSDAAQACWRDNS
ncbi:MAG: hypothetical protein LBI84_06380 [Propionibacteriaceae bacterium]|nr:hypothetical protein [Propionibacteriaceae bacterium]